MPRYYLRYRKEGAMIYTSHLDMNRFFKRACTRAKIELAYTEGFHPHPKMGFALPLSLGYTSYCEYFEFYTVKDLEPEVILSTLQGVMPPGLVPEACVRMVEGEKTLASRCQTATYRILIYPDLAAQGKDPQAFMQQESILVDKKNKKGKWQTQDIKGKIRSFQLLPVEEEKGPTAVLAEEKQSEAGSVAEKPGCSEKETLSLDVCEKYIMETEIDASSASSLSPDLLLKALGQWCGVSLAPENVAVTRVAVSIQGL